ncbi:MAG: methyltransferase [Thermodesulfobacteriota bacterium]
MTLELTLDSIYDGRLKIAQPAEGYRFSLDALLLADFARPSPGQTVIDLGAGVGVVALALAWRLGQGRVLAVEIQPRLAELARKNAEINRQAAVEVLEMDWTRLTLDHLGGPADYAVCNPPYREIGTGRINPGDEEAAARHELRGRLVEAARAAGRILSPSGRLAVVYPASRLVSMIADLISTGFEPKRMRLVHSRAGEKAKRVLVEARLGGRPELNIEPPLYVYTVGLSYTDEAEAILAGRASGGP